MKVALHHAEIAMLFLIASACAALAGEVVHVTISDLAFSPAEITARAGDTIEFVNSDFVDHTATAKDGEWDVLVAAGTAGRLQLTEAGTFDYFCRFHPNMTAKIHVSAN